MSGHPGRQEKSTTCIFDDLHFDGRQPEHFTVKDGKQCPAQGLMDRRGEKGGGERASVVANDDSSLEELLRSDVLVFGTIEHVNTHATLC